MINMVKLPTKKSNLFLRVAKGHFATSHSHINYYIDVTTQKSRLSEAKAVAKELVAAYQHNTIVDTVLCLDGTQVIGTCLANELTKDGFANMNAHQTIYVITPEYTTGSQIILRDNLAPMVKGKHVLILAASITTGYTVQAAVQAVARAVGRYVDDLLIQGELRAADAVGKAAHGSAHAVGVQLVILRGGVAQHHIGGVALAVGHNNAVDDGCVGQQLHFDLIVFQGDQLHRLAGSQLAKIMDSNRHGKLLSSSFILASYFSSSWLCCSRSCLTLAATLPVP